MVGRPKRVSAVTYTEPSEPSSSASPSGSGSGEDELESEVEEDEVEDEDGDGEVEIEEEEGEEEDVEDQMDLDVDAEGEIDEEVPIPPPVKIRFKVNTAPSLGHGNGHGAGMGSASGSGSKGKRVASQTYSGKAKHARIESPVRSEHNEQEEELYSDEMDDEETRSTSPSKLTARQRAKGNKDLQETLVSLPEAGTKKALVLTEAERIQRREESARRRKRQMEQKLQDEQDQTINRLLRAQTSKSRAKLDAPAESTSNSPVPPGSTTVPAEGDEVEIKKSRREREMPMNEGMIRFVSKLDKDGGLIQLVGVAEGREGWIAV